MAAHFLFLAPAFGALALFLVLHVVFWQFIPQPRKGTLALSATALLAYLVNGVADWLWAGFSPATLLWASGPVYAFLIMLYFHFYFGVDRSVSVRILGELVRAPGGRLTPEELDAVYPRRQMLERRLGVMVEKGHIVREGDGYRCAPKGIRLVRLALLGKRLYNLDATG